MCDRAARHSTYFAVAQWIRAEHEVRHGSNERWLKLHSERRRASKQAAVVLQHYECPQRFHYLYAKYFSSQSA
jgi:hypothetical protein